MPPMRGSGDGTPLCTLLTKKVNILIQYEWKALEEEENLNWIQGLRSALNQSRNVEEEEEIPHTPRRSCCLPSRGLMLVSPQMQRCRRRPRRPPVAVATTTMPAVRRRPLPFSYL